MSHYDLTEDVSIPGLAVTEFIVVEADDVAGGDSEFGGGTGEFASADFAQSIEISI